MFNSHQSLKCLFLALTAITAQTYADPYWNIEIKNTTPRVATLNFSDAGLRCFGADWKDATTGQVLQTGTTIQPEEKITIRTYEEYSAIKAFTEHCLTDSHAKTFSIQLAGAKNPYPISLESPFRFGAIPRDRRLNLGNNNFRNNSQNSDTQDQNLTLEIYQDLCRQDKSQSNYLQCLINNNN